MTNTQRLVQALRKLPLDDFDKDPSKIDAAEFVDHSNDFMEAMDAARKALAQYDASASAQEGEPVAPWVEWNGVDETAFREALDAYGMRCVFAARIQTHEQLTWKTNAFERVVAEMRKLAPAAPAGEPAMDLEQVRRNYDCWLLYQSMRKIAGEVSDADMDSAMGELDCDRVYLWLRLHSYVSGDCIYFGSGLTQQQPELLDEAIIRQIEIDAELRRVRAAKGERG